MAKYTEQQVAEMSYAEMRNIKNLSELPESMQQRIRKEFEAGANTCINTGTEIYLVSNDGRKVFRANRHSNRSTGSSVWSVSYSKKVAGICRDVIGYKFGVIEKRFGRTADGTEIKPRVSYKADVMEIINHIEWAKNLIEANKK